MANHVHDLTFSARYPIVKAQGVDTQFRALQDSFWGRFEKTTTKDGKAVMPNGTIRAESVSGSPIVVHRELTAGAKKLDIPMFLNPDQFSKRGRETLSGTGGKRQINFAEVRVNTLRSAEEVRETAMTDIMLSKYGIPGSAKQWLQRQLAIQLQFLEIPYAMYYGISANVLLDDEIAAADTGVVVHSHPNIYVPGIGKVGRDIGSAYPGTDAYEGYCADAIDAITSGNQLSAGWLRDLNTDDTIRRIPYFTTKFGKPFKILVLDKYGMNQLRADSEIKEFNKSAFIDGIVKDNPILTGMEIFFEGWAIFDGGNSIYPLQTASSLPVYGPVTTKHTFTTPSAHFNDVSAYSKWGGMVIGDNAILKGIARDLQFTREVTDHDAIEEIGYNLVMGYSIASYNNRDEGSTGQYLFNDRSALIFYHAEKPGV